MKSYFCGFVHAVSVHGIKDTTLLDACCMFKRSQSEKCQIAYGSEINKDMIADFRLPPPPPPFNEVPAGRVDAKIDFFYIYETKKGGPNLMFKLVITKLY